MAYPILAPSYTWYKSDTLRSTITEIHIVDSYILTGTESEIWNADVEDTGAIKCYIDGTILTIAGNGSGKIALSEDSSYLFSCPISSIDEKLKLFINCTLITGLALLDTSKAKNLSRMFAYCISIQELDISGWDTSNNENLRWAFGTNIAIGTMSLKNIVGIENWDTSKVTDFSATFQYCSNLKQLNINAWDTSNGTSMAAMFYNCASLTTIPVDNWDTGKVTTMKSMFSKCTALQNLNVSNFNLSSCTDISSMFSMNNYGSNSPPLTELDVSNWDVSNVVEAGWAFYGLGNLKALNVSKWDVSNISSFHHMFAWSYSLIIEGLENWNPKNAKTLNALFHSNKNTFYDLSNWNVSQVENFGQMFENQKAVTEIKGLNKWDTSSSKTFYEMFSGCGALTELDLSSFNTLNADDTYIDPYRNATVPGGMYAMFGYKSYKEDGSVEPYNWMMNLKKITLGPNFSFIGNGNCNRVNLSAPEEPYVQYADGCWYTIDNIGYLPSEIPNQIATTYYATKPLYKTQCLVEYGALHQIANTLRNAHGTTDTYKPEDMSAAIATVPGIWEKMQNGTLTEWIDNNITKLSQGGFSNYSNLTTISCEHLIEIASPYCFYQCSNLKNIYLPALQKISGGQTFSYTAITELTLSNLTQAFGSNIFSSSKIQNLNIPLLKEIPFGLCQGCSQLKTLSLPLAQTISGYLCNNSQITEIILPELLKMQSTGYNFRGCKQLVKADFPKLQQISSTYNFQDCTALTTLILRNELSVVTLSNINNFTNSGIANGTGYIYVPAALIEDYKIANNWSTYASQFRAIEDYPDICG